MCQQGMGGDGYEDAYNPWRDEEARSAVAEGGGAPPDPTDCRQSAEPRGESAAVGGALLSTTSGNPFTGGNDSGGRDATGQREDDGSSKTGGDDTVTISKPCAARPTPEQLVAGPAGGKVEMGMTASLEAAMAAWPPNHDQAASA